MSHQVLHEVFHGFSIPPIGILLRQSHQTGQIHRRSVPGHRHSIFINLGKTATILRKIHTIIQLPKSSIAVYGDKPETGYIAIRNSGENRFGQKEPATKKHSFQPMHLHQLPKQIAEIQKATRTSKATHTGNDMDKNGKLRRSASKLLQLIQKTVRQLLPMFHQKKAAMLPANRPASLQIGNLIPLQPGEIRPVTQVRPQIAGITKPEKLLLFKGQQEFTCCSAVIVGIDSKQRKRSFCQF